MLKPKLLTIGEISQLSGVHPKSLRYYDKIGILKPAYVDPETNYRYYDYSQLAVLTAIVTCIELNIPLKQISQFIENAGGKIYFTEMLEYGKQLARKKIQSLNEKIHFFDAFQSAIERRKVRSDYGSLIMEDYPEKTFYAVPFESSNPQDAYHRSLKVMFFDLANNGYKYILGFEYGLLYRYKDGRIDRYQFVEILHPKEKPKNIMTIPAGRYLVKRIQESRIESAFEEFPEEFTDQDEILVIESEVFPNFQMMYGPQYELRILPFHVKLLS